MPASSTSNPTAVKLLKIDLWSFKNYDRASLSFGPELNGFVGWNGMGKTNLLDAIHYLCMGKSHFGRNDIHLSRHGSSFFRLEGRFDRGGKEEKIEVKVEPRRNKEMLRNGLAYERLSDHVGFAPVVFIAPDDTALVREGSEERRRFLDNTLSQIDRDYLRQLIDYQRLLRQRNALLKRMAEQPSPDMALLATYDEQLLEPAAHIHRRRVAFLDEFAPLLRHYVARLSGEQEDCGCAFRSRQGDNPLADLLREARAKDLVLQRTTVGPHKDDLYFSLGDHPLKRYGSQGQVKTFVLALKLAQYDLLRRAAGLAPLLLLDDIFDKLDRRRVQQLLRLMVDQAFGQLFITDTNQQRLEDIVGQVDLGCRIFAIQDGTAKPIDR